MKAACSILLSFGLFASHPLIAQTTFSQREVIELAHNKVSNLTKKLQARVKHCSERRDSNPVPIFDTQRLGEFQVDRRRLGYAVAYLDQRNFQACEGRLRIDLAFHLGSLKHLAEQYEVELEFIDQFKNTLIYPRIRDVEHELAFYSLPPKVKSHLEETVGEQPFNFLRAVSPIMALQD